MSKPGQDRKLTVRIIGQFAALKALQIGDLSRAQRFT
jgi:hypothetical protein